MKSTELGLLLQGIPLTSNAFNYPDREYIEVQNGKIVKVLITGASIPFVDKHLELRKVEIIQQAIRKEDLT